jgi:hypothetical protein
VFKEYYSKSSDTLAFQIGPVGDLWTYYTFVLKQRDCCFVFTRTSFTHARFRYKGYSLLSRQKIDSLFAFINTLDETEVDEEAFLTSASFVNHQSGEIFDVAMETVSPDDHRHLPPDSAVIKFLNFVDNKIKWIETYPLEPDQVFPKSYDKFLISGSYSTEQEQGDFTAKIDIEKKDTYFYYSWDITSENGKLLAAKSSTVDFKQINQNIDQFEFAKKHILDEIKAYKIRNKKLVSKIAESF